MASTNELLDNAMKALNVGSDYALAKALDIHNGRIADYRKGKMQPDAYVAARLACALNRDPLELIAEIEAEHARTPKQREWWARFLSQQHLGKAAALVIGMSIFFVSPTPAGASNGAVSSPCLCILC